MVYKSFVIYTLFCCLKPYYNDRWLGGLIDGGDITAITVQICSGQENKGFGGFAASGVILFAL